MAAVDEAVSKEDSSSSTTISPIVSQIFRPNAQGLCDIMGYRYSLRELLFYLVHTTFFIAYVSSYTPHEWVLSPVIASYVDLSFSASYWNFSLWAIQAWRAFIYSFWYHSHMYHEQKMNHITTESPIIQDVYW